MPFQLAEMMAISQHLQMPMHGGMEGREGQGHHQPHPTAGMTQQGMLRYCLRDGTLSEYMFLEQYRLRSRTILITFAGIGGTPEIVSVRELDLSNLSSSASSLTHSHSTDHLLPSAHSELPVIGANGEILFPEGNEIVLD